MIQACKHLLLIMLLLTPVGLSGCGQQKSAKTTFSRVRDLEARNTKLEEDYRTVAAERTSMGHKLASAQQQISQLEQKLQEMEASLKERDELREKITTVVTDRDSLQNQLQRLSRDLHSLATRVESAVTTSQRNAAMSTVSRQQEK